MDPFRLIDMEASEGGEGEGASGESAAEGEGEQWTGPSQEEWQAAQERLAQFDQLQSDLYGQGEGEGEGEGEEIDLDPFADNFREQLTEIVQEAIAPYAGYQEQQMLGEANEQAMDILHDIATREGEFVMPDESMKLARALAEDHLDEATQQHGFGPKAAEKALEAAYKQVKAIEESIGKSYHDRKMNELRGLAGAPREPQASGQQGTSQLVTREGGDEMDIVRAYTGR